MKRHRGAGALAWAGVTAVTLALAASASAAPASGRKLLNGSRSPAAASTPQTGSVRALTSIDFEIDLKLPDQSGAESFAHAVSTPGNPAYGHYLTPAQWEARFSPTAASVDKIRSFLTQNGFSVVNVSSDHLAIEASGTAAQVERTFGTSLGYHRVDGSKLLLADTNLSVPSDIAGVVAGIAGVSDTRARPDDTTGQTKPAAGTGVQPPPGYRSPQPCGSWFGQILDTELPQYPGYAANPPWDVCGYTGPQLRAAYGLSGPNDGRGETVAVVDAYMSPTLYSDAARLAAGTDPGHPLSPSQFSEIQANSFNEQGSDQCGANGWWAEQTLDVEAVHDVAPGADVLAAGARNCETPALNRILRRIIDRHLADVVSNSYGDDGGDQLDTAGDRTSTDDILLMAAATGVTVTFSSGDDGDEFTTIGQVAADYPASSPWATAVGGTTLEVGADGQRTGEYGWSTANSFLCTPAYQAAATETGGCDPSQLGQWLPIDLALDGGSGGGTSVNYPQPFYQRGVVPSSLSQVNGGPPMRVEPDISMEADPATGVLEGETQTFPNGVYYDTYRIGGTSVASPLLAGVVARADETAGRSLGFLNPRLYALQGHGLGYAFGAVDDIKPVHQDMSRADYINGVDASQGKKYQTRIVDYEGPDQYCPATGTCTSGTVALHTAPGYDNMTGLGSPGQNFVAALARPW